MFYAFDFDGVLADDLVVVLEDVLVVLEDVLVVVEEGGLLRFFGAGRVDFATAAADLTQATRTD